MKSRSDPLHRLIQTLLLVGPGIFCVGYTIGTGTVTKLTTVGSQFGMQLLWVLLLSGLFSWVLMEAYGRYAVVTGETAMHGFRTQLSGGRWLAILTLMGIVISQLTGLPVLVGQVSNLTYDSLRLFIPSIPEQSYGVVIAIAVAILGTTYSLLLVGRYSFFEKVMAVLVTLMSIGFAVSMFVVLPPPGQIARGLVPSIPDVDGGKLLVLAFGGITMAAPTFIVRPLLMKGKGWGSKNCREQSRDALVSAIVMIVMIVISASIMACVAGALFHQGKSVQSIHDLISLLEPVTGRFVVALFLVGTLSAGLSSIVPMAMILPLLIADYRAGELQIRTSTSRILTAVACLAGLAGPVFGERLLTTHRIASQVAQVFVLPLAAGGIFFLLNRKDLMREHRAGFWMNTGLVAAFGLSLMLSYRGLNSLARRFAGGP